jgi:RNA polymerase sigma-70 factor (ECF subfamily)
VANAEAAALFARHHRDVYRFLARMTGRRDLADDLSQEVFLRAVQAIEAGHGSVHHERGWIFAVARHLLTDYHRREQRRLSLEVGDAEPVVEAGQQLAVELAEALARLPVADREVFLLQEVGGLSYEQIADACGCSAEGVRARLYRTRVTLRGMLSL